jgi:AcrR family transcriptional regulator
MGICPLATRGDEIHEVHEGSGGLPTGVSIPDAREQLFEAAERVLLRDGPSGLTSRAVTTEAGVAKGVLHRHFPDFDAFLAELVLDRVSRVQEQAVALRHSAGTGTVAQNLTGALVTLFDSVARGIVGLVISRDSLRARIRQATPSGVPVLTDAASMIASYLTIERELGRISPEAEVDALAPTLVGAVHLLVVGERAAPPDARAVRKLVRSILAGAG